jgi:hypothetical protein
MRLTDLHPHFLGSGGEGIHDAQGNPVPFRPGVGVEFDCPCGCAIPVFVAFANPLDGGPAVEKGWHRTGDDFETLTLTPSILRVRTCTWHGFVTNGEILTC